MNERVRSVGLAMGCVLACLALAPATGVAQSLTLNRIRGSRAGSIQRALREQLTSAGIEISDAADHQLGGRLSGSRWRAYVLRLRLAGPDQTYRIVVRRRNPSRLVNDAVVLVTQRLAEEARQASLAASSDPVQPPAPPMRPDEVTIPLDIESEPQEATQAPTEIETASAASPSAASSAPAPAISFRAGLDWMTRTLDFRDDLFDRLGGYCLPAAPMVNLAGRWFPAMHLTSHAFAALGVEFTFGAAFGVSEEMSDGSSTMASAIDEFGVGLVYRLRPIQALTIEAGFGYGEARLQMDPTGPEPPENEQHLVPAVQYRFLRPMLAAEVALGEGVSIRAAGGWRAVVDSGPLSDEAWFPRSSTTGVDMMLAVRWQFSRYVALSVHAQHIRYLTDIAPEPGDRLVAGGAADEWTRAGAELIVLIPGAP